MDVTDRFALGFKDRPSPGSSRPFPWEPEQVSRPSEPDLGKAGPELEEILVTGG